MASRPTLGILVTVLDSGEWAGATTSSLGTAIVNESFSSNAHWRAPERFSSDFFRHQISILFCQGGLVGLPLLIDDFDNLLKLSITERHCINKTIDKLLRYIPSFVDVQQG